MGLKYSKGRVMRGSFFDRAVAFIRCPHARIMS
jgi:hypothetical protein